MSDLEEAKRLLGEAQALMYVDDPPGKNEIKAYQNITAALALMEGEGAWVTAKQMEEMLRLAAQIGIEETLAKMVEAEKEGKPTEEIKGSPFKGGGWRHG